jgi:hypothetical protein
MLYIKLGLQIIRIIIFIFIFPRGCSMCIQICFICIQNTPEATSSSILCSLDDSKERWILLADSQFGPFVLRPVISWRSQVSLYAHSKCIRSCCMCIQNIAGAALFISQRQVENWIQELVLIISVHRWRKPALPAFMIKIQYGSSHNTMDVQRAISQRIQN